MEKLPVGRILGVDVGTVRTGVAVSDENGFLASALCTIKVSGIHPIANAIREKALEKNVKLIVIGNPVNMNGTIGESSERIKLLRDALAEICDIPTVLFDERCTTMAAHSILNMTDTRGKKRKAVIDNLSAEIILQDYLDSRRSNLR